MGRAECELGLQYWTASRTCSFALSAEISPTAFVCYSDVHRLSAMNDTKALYFIAGSTHFKGFFSGFDFVLDWTSSHHSPEQELPVDT